MSDKVKPYESHDDEQQFKPGGCTRFAFLLDEGKGVVVMTLLTIYVLFAADIQVWLCPIETDIVFTVLTSACFVLFMLEFTVFTFGKPGYRFSFYFALDLVATLTLITEIPYIWTPLYEGLSGDSETFTADLSVAKAGKASRAGTKAGRILRVLRVIRLFRIVKLYKYATEEEKKEAQESEKAKFADLGSDIGRSLNERTTRLVIVGVLCMLVILSGGFLTVESTDNSIQFIIDRLDSYEPYYGRSTTLVNASYAMSSASYDYFYQKFGWRILVLLETPPCLRPDPNLCVEPVVLQIFMADQINSIRSIAIKKLRSGFSSGACAAGSTAAACVTPQSVFTVWIDDTVSIEKQAWCNMLLTIFVLLLLGIGTIQFSKDAQEMVIEPIERMISFVAQLAENPLAKLRRRPKEKHAGTQYETEQLELTLLKLAGLLQVGFGAAGAEIIGKNLTSNGLNVMIPGQKVFAIFGFCDIRHFNDSTEFLQEQVMKFVNQIAEIVHERCNRFKGAVNKNIGNSFLLVWRFPPDPIAIKGDEDSKHPKDESLHRFSRGFTIKSLRTPTHKATPQANYFPDAETLKLMSEDDVNGGSPVKTASSNRGSLEANYVQDNGTQAGTIDTQAAKIHSLLKDPVRRAGMTDTANQALCAFIHTITNVATNQDLTRWRKQDFDPNYVLEMGFGLHVGWAIEGAIGSTHKVDLSYLSPNVNMAARLKEATKQYGVYFLMSGSFYALLSPQIQELCRHLDRVCVKGSVVPMDIYTFDVSNDSVASVADMVKGDAASFNLTVLGYGGQANFDKRDIKLNAVLRKVQKVKNKARHIRDKVNRTIHRHNRIDAATAGSSQVSDNQGGKESDDQLSTEPGGNPKGINRIGSTQRKGMGGSVLSSLPLPGSLAAPLTTVPVNPDSAQEPVQVEKEQEHYTFDMILAMCLVLQSTIPPEFIKRFNKGSKCYMAGDWGKAKTYLQKCLKCEGYENDKSTKLLMGVMEETQFVAPSTWRGYRMLTSK